METIVLPAQDHLANERYRKQEGVMSGMMYPLGGLPRTRRKVKSPHPVDNRKRMFEKGVDSSKNSAEMTLAKVGEKSSDRRKGLDRRPVEKKPITVTNNSQINTSQMKASVITILRRPQTKEAAAENVALFTGRPIEGVTKQILKSALAMSQHVLKQTGEEAELVRSEESREKDGEIESVQSRTSSNASPKKGMKKKPSRDFPAKIARTAAAVAEVAQVESQRTEDAELFVESRRPKNAPRRRSDDVELHSSEHRITAELDLSHVSPSSMDDIVPSLSNDGVSTIPGVLQPAGSSDSLVGVIGQAFGRQGWGSRSGSFREVSCGNDNGVELFFVPSSPPSRSERWAGPGYTNSPPPSTLPFPTFPRQREKTSMTEVTLADMVLREPQYTNQEPAPSPTRVASLFLSATVMESPFVDPSSATKDLRRMLNLDVEDGFDVSSEWSEGGVESATQSLKRMLQLG